MDCISLLHQQVTASLLRYQVVALDVWQVVSAAYASRLHQQVLAAMASVGYASRLHQQVLAAGCLRWVHQLQTTDTASLSKRGTGMTGC